MSLSVPQLCPRSHHFSVLHLSPSPPPASPNVVARSHPCTTDTTFHLSLAFHVTSFPVEPLSFPLFHSDPVLIQDYSKLAAQSSKSFHFHDTSQTLYVDRNPYDPCNLCNHLHQLELRCNLSTVMRSGFDELCSNQERKACYESHCIKAMSYV